MKNYLLKPSLLFLFFLTSSKAFSQTNILNIPGKNFPDTIQIKQSQLDDLFHYRKGNLVEAPNNKYLDGAEVLLNTVEKDHSRQDKLLRLKLNYFTTSFLWVQVNGKYSTQVFIFSDDPSGFYKATFSGNTVFLIRCRKESIVSE